MIPTTLIRLLAKKALGALLKKQLSKGKGQLLQKAVEVIGASENQPAATQVAQAILEPKSDPLKRTKQTRFKTTLVSSISATIICILAMVLKMESVAVSAVGILGALVGLYTHNETKRKSD